MIGIIQYLYLILIIVATYYIFYSSSVVALESLGFPSAFIVKNETELRIPSGYTIDENQTITFREDIGEPSLLS